MRRAWQYAYWALTLLFVLTAALNRGRVRGGFLTSHLADLVVPAWLYVVFRHPPSGRRAAARDGVRLEDRAPPDARPGWRRWVAATPGRTALTLLVGSTATELAQRAAPRGIFAGTFDPWDLVAFAVSLGTCYVIDRVTDAAPHGGKAGFSRP